MDALQSQEVAAFSEALERLYKPVALEDFPTHLFAVITALIPGVTLTFDEVSNRTGVLRHSRNIVLENPDEWLAQLAVNLEHDHPAITYVRGGGTERFLQLSDFLTQRQLRQTALYQENLKPVGVAYQVAVMLPLPGYAAGLTVNRGSRFRSGEISLIRLLCPHILRAHANARLYSALRREGAARSTATPEPSGFGSLTLREQEVLRWVAQGKRDREIAVILGASHRTVQKHVQSILAKLGTETRSGAVSEFLARSS